MHILYHVMKDGQWHHISDLDTALSQSTAKDSKGRLFWLNKHGVEAQEWRIEKEGNLYRMVQTGTFTPPVKTDIPAIETKPTSKEPPKDWTNATAEERMAYSKVVQEVGNKYFGQLIDHARGSNNAHKVRLKEIVDGVTHSLGSVGFDARLFHGEGISQINDKVSRGSTGTYYSDPFSGSALRLPTDHPTAPGTLAVSLRGRSDDSRNKTFIHEFGHALDLSARQFLPNEGLIQFQSDRAAMRAEYNAEKTRASELPENKDRIRRIGSASNSETSWWLLSTKAVSGYALYNDREWFAEHFAQYVRSGGESKLAGRTSTQKEFPATYKLIENYVKGKYTV